MSLCFACIGFLKIRYFPHLMAKPDVLTHKSWEQHNEDWWVRKGEDGTSQLYHHPTEKFISDVDEASLDGLITAWESRGRRGCYSIMRNVSDLALTCIVPLSMVLLGRGYEKIFPDQVYLHTLGHFVAYPSLFVWLSSRTSREERQKKLLNDVRVHSTEQGKESEDIKFKRRFSAKVGRVAYALALGIPALSVGYLYSTSYAREAYSRSFEIRESTSGRADPDFAKMLREKQEDMLIDPSDPVFQRVLTETVPLVFSVPWKPGLLPISVHPSEEYNQLVPQGKLWDGHTDGLINRVWLRQLPMWDALSISGHEFSHHLSPSYRQDGTLNVRDPVYEELVASLGERIWNKVLEERYGLTCLNEAPSRASDLRRLVHYTEEDNGKILDDIAKHLYAEIQLERLEKIRQTNHVTLLRYVVEHKPDALRAFLVKQHRDYGEALQEAVRSYEVEPQTIDDGRYEFWSLRSGDLEAVVHLPQARLHLHHRDPRIRHGVVYHKGERVDAFRLHNLRVVEGVYRGTSIAGNLDAFLESALRPALREREEQAAAELRDIISYVQEGIRLKRFVRPDKFKETLGPSAIVYQPAFSGKVVINTKHVFTWVDVTQDPPEDRHPLYTPEFHRACKAFYEVEKKRYGW